MFTQLPPIINILLLSITASLGTGLGGLIAVIRKPGKRTYGLLMGVTAGVMICLSFLDLVNEAWSLAGPWVATIGFAVGAIFMLILDHFSPHIRFGEKEVRGVPSEDAVPVNNNSLFGRRRFRGRRLRGENIDFRLANTGLLLAVGITLHNLPEGIAVGAGYLHNPQFGLFIAVAILLHNIPEGIATALPLCKSGICRWDAFRIAFLSGFAEPVGALLAGLFLVTFQRLVPFALAFAGGVMVFITLDELIPTAREYGHEHFVAIGIILGSIFVFILSGLLGINS